MYGFVTKFLEDCIVMEHTGPILPSLLAKEYEGMRRLSVLCVEDEDSDYFFLEKILTDSSIESNFDVTRSTTLQEALDEIASHDDGDSLAFDIVLLDLSLPDSSGKETFVRLAEAAPKIPVIILSCDTDRDFSIEMVQQGAQDFLIKERLSPDWVPRAIFYAIERKREVNERDQLIRKLHRTTEDLKTAQTQLIQAEKLDSLGRLAAGVAHEVRNPLGAIRLGVDYITKRQKDFPDAGFEVACSEMHKAINRADDIIQGMVDYSREDTVKLEVHDPNELILESIKFVQYDLNRENTTLTHILENPIPKVRIDMHRMQQVLINLITNSVQAMKPCGGGEITITTALGTVKNIVRDEGLRDSTRLRKDDDVVVITVRDTGPGIPYSKIDRVFEPFFTTKPTGEGTGLGLSVVDRIVRLHRGHIRVANVENPAGLETVIILKAEPHSLPPGPSSEPMKDTSQSW